MTRKERKARAVARRKEMANELATIAPAAFENPKKGSIENAVAAIQAAVEFKCKKVPQESSMYREAARLVEVPAVMAEMRKVYADYKAAEKEKEKSQ